VVTELGRVVELDWTVMDLSFNIVRGATDDGNRS